MIYISLALISVTLSILTLAYVVRKSRPIVNVSLTAFVKDGDFTIQDSYLTKTCTHVAGQPCAAVVEVKGLPTTIKRNSAQKR